MRRAAATTTTENGQRRATRAGAPGGEHPPLTGLQAEAWRLLWQQFLRDAESLAECRVWEERRRRAAGEMRGLLARFLEGAISIEELRSTFDRRTRGDWDAFGLRGAAGAMFLNQLARRAADGAPRLVEALRQVLPAPADDEAAAASRLAAFVAALEENGGSGEGRALQAAHGVFFATAWWHVQDAERWPMFQPSARRALREEQDVYVPVGDAVPDYLALRAAFGAVAATLRATNWELEYLCWWRQHRELPAAAADDGRAEPLFYEPGVYRPTTAVREPRPPRVRYGLPADRAPEPVPDDIVDRSAARSRGSRQRPAHAADAAPTDATRHTRLQWLLATMGRRLGCRVWVAANDWSKRWEGQSLGELSVRRLPSLGLSADSQRVVGMIDVVWLRAGNEVAAAFEVEHTTSVYSGLLRMADLAALSPNLRFPLYIVAPRARLEKVRRELARPTFRALGLHERCAYFSGEALVEAAESIMRWANDPSAIERLASRATDVPGDTVRDLDDDARR